MTTMQPATILLVALFALAMKVLLEMVSSVMVRIIDQFSVTNMIFFLSDIDECALDTDGCDQGCINTHGSFQCNCSEGYLLNEDGFTCDGNLSDYCKCMCLM